LEECTFITKLTDFKLQWTIKEGKGVSYLRYFDFLRNVTVLHLPNLNNGNIGLKYFGNLQTMAKIFDTEFSPPKKEEKEKFSV